jgi:hypothetical protein
VAPEVAAKQSITLPRAKPKSAPTASVSGDPGNQVLRRQCTLPQTLVMPIASPAPVRWHAELQPLQVCHQTGGARCVPRGGEQYEAAIPSALRGRDVWEVCCMIDRKTGIGIRLHHF